jgi:hypothetical protein
MPRKRDSGSISPRRTRSHDILRENLRLAQRLIGGTLPARLSESLKNLSRDFDFSLPRGELQLLNNSWYVTHTGLLRLARRKRCRGIHVEAVDSLCDSAANRFVLKATVYPSKDSAGFVGYGDADPSNVSLLVRGAEMRIAETQAAVRALPGLLSLFLLWFAFLAWRPQAFGILPDLYQGALKEELDLLIRRAVLPFREFFDPRFQAGLYSDKYGDSWFVHLQITNNFSC